MMDDADPRIRAPRPKLLRALIQGSALMANFANSGYAHSMTTMNVSLPEELKAFVDAQTQRGGYGSTSEFVRELIRREQDRQQLRSLLLDGASSSTGPIADQGYFSALRVRLNSTD